MSSAATEASAAPVSCRHFVHLVLDTESSGRIVVPLIFTLQAEDAHILNAQLTAVLEDLVFILRLHAPRILPSLGTSGGDGSSGFTSGVASSAAAGAVAVYHGQLVSATFTVREPEPYAVLEAAHDSRAGGGSNWTNLPLAAFRLCANVRHKASERRRRKERLFSSPRKLDAYVLAESGTSKLDVVHLSGDSRIT